MMNTNIPLQQIAKNTEWGRLRSLVGQVLYAGENL